MRISKAFTLIELLIVVAIIAILAAIAVPNFLEAQVRSKVSRAQADMRSTSTALEAYAVDWNRYPVGYMTIREAVNNGVAPPTANFPTSSILRNWYGLSRLTTPVAYTTTVFIDPFTIGGSFLFDRTDTVRGENGFPYWYDDYQPWTFLQPLGFDGFPQNRYRRVRAKGYTWSISSAGPERSQMMMWFALDGEPFLTSNNHIIYPYDPTNGTVSEGFIGRTNKGVYTEVNQTI